MTVLPVSPSSTAIVARAAHSHTTMPPPASASAASATSAAAMRCVRGDAMWAWTETRRTWSAVSPSLSSLSSSRIPIRRHASASTLASSSTSSSSSAPRYHNNRHQRRPTAASPIASLNDEDDYSPSQLLADESDSQHHNPQQTDSTQHRLHSRNNANANSNAPLSPTRQTGALLRAPNSAALLFRYAEHMRREDSPALNPIHLSVAVQRLGELVAEEHKLRRPTHQVLASADLARLLDDVRVAVQQHAMTAPCLVACVTGLTKLCNVFKVLLTRVRPSTANDDLYNSNNNVRASSPSSPASTAFVPPNTSITSVYVDEHYDFSHERAPFMTFTAPPALLDALSRVCEEVVRQSATSFREFELLAVLHALAKLHRSDVSLPFLPAVFFKCTPVLSARAAAFQGHHFQQILTAYSSVLPHICRLSSSSSSSSSSDLVLDEPPAPSQSSSSSSSPSSSDLLADLQPDQLPVFLRDVSMLNRALCDALRANPSIMTGARPSHIVAMLGALRNTDVRYVSEWLDLITAHASAHADSFTVRELCAVVHRLSLIPYDHAILDTLAHRIRAEPHTCSELSVAEVLGVLHAWATIRAPEREAPSSRSASTASSAAASYDAGAPSPLELLAQHVNALVYEQRMNVSECIDALWALTVIGELNRAAEHAESVQRAQQVGRATVAAAAAASSDVLYDTIVGLLDRINAVWQRERRSVHWKTFQRALFVHASLRHPLPALDGELVHTALAIVRSNASSMHAESSSLQRLLNELRRSGVPHMKERVLAPAGVLAHVLMRVAPAATTTTSYDSGFAGSRSSRSPVRSSGGHGHGRATTKQPKSLLPEWQFLMIDPKRLPAAGGPSSTSYPDDIFVAFLFHSRSSYLASAHVDDAQLCQHDLVQRSLLERSGYVVIDVAYNESVSFDTQWLSQRLAEALSVHARR